MGWTLKLWVIFTLAAIFVSNSSQLIRKSHQLDRLSNVSNNNNNNNSSVRDNDVNSEFDELGESDITSLLNLTLQSVQNSSQYQEEAKKHEIVLMHRNPHWIEHVAKKLAPLFSAISLWNEKCWTADYDQGTCYSRKECIQRGGKPNGYCAAGFGVCCSFAYSCNSVTHYNRTYFMNTEFPHGSQEFGTCMHRASKLADICQIRLDFEIFELERPDSTGVCTKDEFHIEGIDFKMPALCGDLTGHHLYLPVATMAPAGCAQYHHGIAGRITSFNYVDGMEANMNNLDYGVCVRREKGFCAVQWSVCGYKKKRKKRSSNFHPMQYIERQEEQESLVLNNPERMSKKLWETGYDSQTEQVSSVADSSWQPFIPPANYFHHHKKAQQEQAKPQNHASSSSNSLSSVMQEETTNSESNQKVESTERTADFQLLVQNENEYHYNEVNGPIKFMIPVASHIYEYSRYPYAAGIHLGPQSFYNPLNQHVSSTTDPSSIVNHVYGPTFRRPIVSFHPVTQNKVYLKETISRVPQKKKLKIKKNPSVVLTSAVEPNYVKKKHHVIASVGAGIKEVIGNTIATIHQKPTSVLSDFGDKIHSLPTPSITGIHGTIADKINALPKPSINGIHGAVTDKINALAKPLPSLVGGHDLIGKIPVISKPVGSISGIKGSILDKVHANPKPPISQASLLIPGKIPEKPKLPVSGAALLKPGKIVEHPKLPPKALAAALLKPGKITEHPKLPPKAVAAALLKPGKIKEHAKLPPTAVSATLLKPGKIHVKPKLPLKGSGFGLLGRPKVKPKLKPKYPINLKKPWVKPKPIGKPKPKPGQEQCKNNTKVLVIPIPIPLPIPIPIPIVPVVVVPFPFGGGGGGGGGGGFGGHGHRWENDGHVISVTEPYMIRVVTDKKREDGLSSFCMNWEQISCNAWHNHPEYLKHEQEEYDEYDDDEYDDDRGRNYYYLEGEELDATEDNENRQTIDEDGDN